jgi:predicted RNA-binding protein (virulence factor B family)
LRFEPQRVFIYDDDDDNDATTTMTTTTTTGTIASRKAL